MKRKATAIAAALGMFGLIGVARAGDDAKFNEHKANMLRDLDQEISLLQSARSCLSSAKDHDAAKHCHEDMRQAKEKVHASHQEQRKKEIDEHIKQLQEEKQKMDSAPPKH